MFYYIFEANKGLELKSGGLKLKEQISFVSYSENFSKKLTSLDSKIQNCTLKSMVKFVK